jgi:hypothetical protein
MTEIHIGSEEVEKFLVRKDLATRHSRVIEKALDPKSDWKEAEENVVRLPEETPETFQAFLTFLDTGVIHLRHFGEANDEDTDGEVLKESTDWDSITDAWLLGDRILSTSFKDAVVDMVVSLAVGDGELPTSMHQDIFKGSAYKSGMRKLLVDIAVHGWSPAMLEQQESDPAVEFFKDVAVSCVRRTAYILHPTTTQHARTTACVSYGNSLLRCHYHEHGEHQHCYRTMFGQFDWSSTIGEGPGMVTSKPNGPWKRLSATGEYYCFWKSNSHRPRYHAVTIPASCRTRLNIIKWQ